MRNEFRKYWEERVLKRHKESLVLLDIFIILTVVVVCQAHTHAETFYILHLCSLFHVNHTSIRNKYIYHPSWKDTSAFAPQFRKVSPSQCQQELESNEVHFYLVHEDYWLGPRNPTPGLIFLSVLVQWWPWHQYPREVEESTNL